MAMGLAISSALMAQIVAEATKSPDEVCGLLLGAVVSSGKASIDAILPCRNVAADPSRHFEIDPATLIAAHRATRGGGPVIVGHYHSHPSGTPVPSATDAAASRADGMIWIIVAGAEVRAWRAVRDGTVEGRFDPVALAVAPATRVGHETQIK